MDINLCINGNADSVDTIKYAALYFDKINIERPLKSIRTDRTNYKKGDIKNVGKLGSDQCDAIGRPLWTEEIIECTQILHEEGLLKYNDTYTNEKLNSVEKQDILDYVFYMAPTIITREHSAFHETGDAELLTDKNIIRLLKDINTAQQVLYDSDQPSVRDAEELFSTLLLGVCSHLFNSEPVLNEISIIDEVFNEYLLQFNSIQKKQPQIAINSINILLPYIKNASIDDIMEIRYLAGDELLELRNYVDNVTKLFDPERIQTMSSTEIQNKVDSFVKPAVKQFERKIENIKLVTCKEFLSNIADPKSYVPLISTLFGNVSPQYAFALSLGIIGAKTYIDYRRNYNELKNDPLYFTVALNNHLCKRTIAKK